MHIHSGGDNVAADVSVNRPIPPVEKQWGHSWRSIYIYSSTFKGSELRSCVKVSVAVLGSQVSVAVLGSQVSVAVLGSQVSVAVLGSQVSVAVLGSQVSVAVLGSLSLISLMVCVAVKQR